MSDYIQDPNNSKKQIPGPKPDNAFERANTPTNCVFVKAPSSVLITPTVGKVGFIFGSSASFANLGGGGEPARVTGSSQYRLNEFSGSAVELNIHPTAVSACAGDISNVTFIYKGGLDGLGRS